MTRKELLDWFKSTREVFQELGVTAVMPETILTEIEARLRKCFEALDNEELTLEEASRLGGYSVDHLRRLVNDGTVPNAGVKGRPRIRVADVPFRRQRPFATTSPGAYDPSADARNLLGRRGGKRA